MKIILAEHLGMCFGVRDAIALALQQAAAQPLTVLGELVHNEAVLASLLQRGIRIERDPATIRCAVNVGLAWTDESLRQQFGATAEMVRAGVLGGSDDELVDRVGAYADAVTNLQPLLAADPQVSLVSGGTVTSSSMA